VAARVRRDRQLSKRNCFIRFDDMNYWLSRTRDLMSNAETHSHRALRDSLREIGYGSRRTKFAPVVAFHNLFPGMEEHATDANI
jgi:hypothetical protein